tara:strand:+ start:467 stop:841 length:375 start_codon:yes stop_codon:yes gene_type:complete
MKKYILLISSFVIYSETCFAETLYTCIYPNYSSDELKIEKAEDFSLRFLVRDDETASMIGNNGAAPVFVYEHPDKINFIELTGTGNIMLTAIDEGLKSVHSRHTVSSFAGGLIPSQYYGQCVIQ